MLTLNAYPVLRHQYLLLHNDSNRSQNEPLDLQDVAASLSFLGSASDPHYIFYNCTKFAGCSRYHKHLQIVKKPETAMSGAMAFKFFPDRKDPGVRVPYLYFLHYFTSAESLESTSVYKL
jgi:ATP adenylyltransferase